jgi:glutamine synthetase
METNLYELTAPERRSLGIESLPESLGEAIAAAEESEIVEKALGPELRERLIALKRREWDEYRVQLSAWELERYLPVL